MAETKQVQAKPEQEAFKSALQELVNLAQTAVTSSNEAVMSKGTSVRLTADECNALVQAFRKAGVKGSDVEIKAAIPDIAKLVMREKFAGVLGVVF